MAYSYIQVVGDGVTSVYTLALSGPSPGYISQDHIFVSYDGILQDQSDREFVTEQQVRLLTVPAGGTVIKVFRESGIENPIVNFEGGAALSESNLDLNTTQMLMLAQEVEDTAGSTTEELDAAVISAAASATSAAASAVTSDAYANTAEDVEIEAGKYSGLHYRNKTQELVDSITATPGDMLKSVYDTNDSGVVDFADTANALGGAQATAITANSAHAASTSNPHGVDADTVNALAKDNTDVYTPTLDYHPATKKTVDDAVISAGAGDMTKVVYDTNDDGTVDSADTAAALTGTQATAITDNTAKVSYSTAASDAVALNTAKVTNATHTGDVTGSTVLTLAEVNANIGSFTAANITVNAKGLVTAATDGSGGSGSGTVIDVQTYGTDTAAITSAFAAAGQGDTVLFSKAAGGYTLTSPVTASFNGIIQGGMNTVTLSGTGGFILSGTKLLFEDFFLNSAATNTASIPACTGVSVTQSYVTVQNVYIDRLDKGIVVTGNVDHNINNIKMRNIKTTAIELANTVGTTMSDIKYDTDTGSYSKVLQGLHVYGEGSQVSDCDFINADVGLKIHGRSVGTTDWNFFNTCFFDQCTYAAYIYNTTTSQQVRGQIFDQCWFASSTGAAGVYITGPAVVDGITFQGCTFINNFQSAISLNSVIKNLDINGCVFSGNSAVSSGTYSTIVSNRTIDGSTEADAALIRNNFFGSWGALANNQNADIQRGNTDATMFIDGNVALSTVTTSNVIAGSSVAPEYGVNFGGIPSASGGGSGDMTKAVYDTNNDGTVNSAHTSAALTGTQATAISSNTSARHAQSHTVASHSDTTATGSELEVLTNGSTTTLHYHSAPSHTIASHSDTTATGSELETLTNGSTTALHYHSAPSHSLNSHTAATGTVDMGGQNLGNTATVSNTGIINYSCGSGSTHNFLHSTSLTAYLASTLLAPNSANTVALGSSGQYWSDVQSQVFHQKGGGYLDTMDDLAVMAEFTPMTTVVNSEEVLDLHPETGTMQIDLNALPELFTNKATIRKEIQTECGPNVTEEHIEILLADPKKAGHLLSRDLGMFGDLTSGAVRQLDIEMKEVFELLMSRITTLENKLKAVGELI